MLEKNKIQEFIDQIIYKAGLDKMPADFLEEYSDRLTEEAYKSMGIAVMKELPDEKVSEFSELVEIHKEDYKMINNYLKENIQNFENKMSVVLKEFAYSVLEKAEKLS